MEDALEGRQRMNRQAGSQMGREARFGTGSVGRLEGSQKTDRQTAGWKGRQMDKNAVFGTT